MFRTCLLTFAAGALVEGICAQWVTAVSRGQASRSGLLSMAWAVALLYGLTEAMHEGWPAAWTYVGDWSGKLIRFLTDSGDEYYCIKDPAFNRQFGGPLGLPDYRNITVEAVEAARHHVPDGVFPRPVLVFEGMGQGLCSCGEPAESQILKDGTRSRGYCRVCLARWHGDKIA